MKYPCDSCAKPGSLDVTQPQHAKLTEGPVGRTLVRLTIPMAFAIFTMIAFNLADRAFLGRLGTAELAAISFTFPVVMIVGSIAQGIGVGMSAVISRSIGQGNQDRVQRLTTDGLALAFIIVALLSIVGLATINPVFRMLGATDQTLPLIRQYMTIWYVGVCFVIIPMTGNAAIRATGDMKTPAAIMMTAAAINVVLDPLMIFGIGPFPAMGIQGAALATMIARAMSLAASLWVLIRREQMVTFARPRLSETLDSWRKILFVGVPAAGTQLLVPLSTAVITGLVATYGATAVAGFGVASRVEAFGLGIVMALSATVTPFSGQNWGADRPDRVREAVSLAQRFALLWGLGLFGVYFLLGTPIAKIFTTDTSVIPVVRDYLRIVPVGYGLVGVLMVSTSALNALGRPLHSAGLSLLRLFVLYLPLAFLGARLFNLNGVFAAAAVASVVAGAGGWWVAHRSTEEIDRSGLTRLVPEPATD